MSLLITSPDAAAAAALADRLAAQGVHPVGHCACSNLVREAVRLAPRAVVLACDEADDATLTALQLLAESTPRPVVMLAPAARGSAERLRAAQVLAWLAPQTDAAALQAALALAQAHFDHARAQAKALAETQARLDERKWVDRAKGVLMRAHPFSEDEAFGLLRSASMQANLRLGEVSRGLVAAAEAAEGVNRAGQLRMLSQRFVKALAQRRAGVDRLGADEVLSNTAQRLQRNLERLVALVPEAHAERLARVQAAWQSLRPHAESPQTALAEADAHAELLLAAAEALTEALDGAGGARSLRVVNQCGRQRMLAQRLAKQALLASLLDGAAAAAQAEAMVATLADVEAGLQALERAPLASDEIRAALAKARGQWQRMRQQLSQTAEAARAALVHDSEALLASFDHLTSLYERSLQLLLG